VTTAATTGAGIDLGIVVSDAEASLAFYRDALGFAVAGSNPLPGGGTMHRLTCGASTLKLCAPDPAAASTAPGGGLFTAQGIRYFTISVTNIDELVASLAAAGTPVVWDPRDIAPTARVAIVQDPDGNHVEFLQLKAAG
jgi:catechol 2,3-dioxygenase-like lactoylglutathione lyase family enzyme